MLPWPTGLHTLLQWLAKVVWGPKHTPSVTVPPDGTPRPTTAADEPPVAADEARAAADGLADELREGIEHIKDCIL